MTTPETQKFFPESLPYRLVRVIRWAYPPWWFWHWFVRRWVGHDCDTQPITCRSEWLFRTPSWMWLDV